MLDDLRPPPQTETDSAGSLYGILRKEKTWHEGKPIGWWYVMLLRQGKDIQRDFFDQIFGGREMSLAMAIAWRDAVLRLIPPVTKRQAQTALRRSNTSGVSGVVTKRNQGQVVGWVAILSTPERNYKKSFSTKVYGHDRAKELAIAERQRLLEQYGTDAFITQNTHATRDATQHFGYLLDNPQPTLAPTQIAARIRALHQWFDQLYPEHLFVRAKVYPSRTRGYTRINVRISLDRTQNHVVTQELSLAKHSYQQRLPEIWQFIQATITDWHGKDRWQSFATRHEKAFMASTAETGFQARDYSAPLGYPDCLTPPASLQPMLAGFALPALPYLAPVPETPAAHK